MGIIRDKRKFDGKVFILDGAWGFYGAASKEAEALRKRGYFVRITTAKGYKGETNYITWKRKK